MVEAWNEIWTDVDSKFRLIFEMKITPVIQICGNIL